jgi:hypothetical protein
MTTASPTVRPPLDDVMFSMDVVDTLRQEARIVERELNEESKREQLKDRLREIYRGQGIDVPDYILEEGVRALEERRFVYDPPKLGIEGSLARLYVTRWQWGKWLGGGLAVVMLLWGGWQVFYEWPREHAAEQARIELTETLPEQLNTLYSAIETETDVPQALDQAAQLRDSGLAAAQAGQRDAAREAQAELSALLRELRLAYEVTIVSRPGELSGLWRIPRVNPESRNYYLIVEALDDDGQPVERIITNEETGEREAVKKWAVRVSEQTFARVRADKEDDGIIQNNVIGVKERGAIETDWRVDMQGGALTQW